MAKKTKVEEPEKMSMYEEDLIWMSYRYCIGRHTIASHMHAGEIAKHEYDRLSPERRQFMALDIRREIAHCLSFSPFNFRMDPNIIEKNYKPLEILLQFFEDNDIHTREQLKGIASINTKITRYSEPQDIIIETSEKKYNVDTHLSIFDILDLIPWMNLASCFDVENHKRCLVNVNGDEKVLEYFDSWTETREPGQEFGFKKVKITVDAYLKNPEYCGYIIEDYIVKDEI
jgi:hypothetical protein